MMATKNPDIPLEDSMKTEQLSVFLENRAGRLAEVIQVLTDARINIRALSLADTSDFGILRMIVSDQEKARILLKERGFTLGRTTVVAVEVPDRPGGLNSVLQLVSANNINVEYMYAYVKPNNDMAIMIFRFDKVDEAIGLLLGKNFRLVSQDALCAM